MDEGGDTCAAILKVLKFSPRGLSITDVAKKIRKERNSTAKYLDVLRAEGKVEVRQIGTARVYSLAQRVPLSAFLCFTRNMILIIDNDLNIVQANDQYVRLAGGTKQELIGKNLREERLPVVSDTVAMGVIESTTREQVITDIRSYLDGEELFFKMEVIPTTFEGGETGLTIILEDITEKKRHLKNMEFLARTAMELVDLPPETDIYLYIADRIKELLPENPKCYVESFDESKGMFFLRAIIDHEFRENVRYLNEGKDLIGISFDVNRFFTSAPFFESPSTMKEFREMRFRPFFHDEELSFYDVCARKFPKKLCDAFIQGFGIGKMYAIGLVWQMQLFGVIGILLAPDEVLENKQAIESFLRQASIAISRRQTEERLMRSERRFRELVAFAKNPAIIINPEGRIMQVNPMFIETFGYTQEDIPTGEMLCEKAFPDPGFRREAVSLLDPDPRDDRNAVQRIYPVRCKNGNGKSVVFRPLVLSDGTRVVTLKENTS